MLKVKLSITTKSNEGLENYKMVVVIPGTII